MIGVTGSAIRGERPASPVLAGARPVVSRDGVPTGPVPVVVRRSLAASRAAGVAFPEAWEIAFAAATSLPTGGTDRSTWKAALLATRRAWGRAYVGQPETRGDVVMRALSPWFDGRGEGGTGSHAGGTHGAGAVLPAVDDGRVA